MKLNIGLVPFVKKKYDFFVKSVDMNLIKFVNFCFKNSNIKILHGQKTDLDLIILSGSNELLKYSNNTEDKIRSKIDTFYLNIAIKRKIPVIGICYGAQFIAKKYKSKIIRSSNHVKKKHQIIFKNSFKSEKKIFVNSFHNYIISKASKKINPLAFSTKDKSVEYFKVKGLKIAGIMWHPERNEKFSKIDKLIFKSIL
tara:strand:- start:85 stop:678 length:594 start_codon:yes stop_codon:yes gene_type:complete